MVTVLLGLYLLNTGRRGGAPKSGLGRKRVKRNINIAMTICFIVLLIQRLIVMTIFTFLVVRDFLKVAAMTDDGHPFLHVRDFL